MQLRDYQKQAVLSIINDWKNGETPYANLITGSGKSLVLAEITRRALALGYRVLQLVPTKELCSQNYQELVNHCGFSNEYGIVCSQLGKQQFDRKAVIAMVDSFLTKRFKCGAFDVVLIDECDLVGYDPKSKFRKILDALIQRNPSIRIAGVTGSPYRMGTGLLENDHPTHGKSIFTNRCFCTDELIPEMIQQGFLSHIESISGDIQADLSDVKLNSIGEYNTEIMAAKFNAIIPHAVRDMVVKINTYAMSTVLVFASNIANAELIIEEYKEVTGLNNIRMVSGKSEKKSDRTKNIDWFSNSPGQRILVNVGLLTRGYNYRALDCVVFMRSTMSLSLYVQIVGRVIRSHEDKDQGYIIDYGGNIERFGAIDQIKPPEPKKKKGKAVKKECFNVANELLVKEINEQTYTLIPGQKCGYMNHASAKICKLCDAEFIPDPDAPGKYSMRSHAEILALKEAKKEQTHEVTDVFFDTYTGKQGVPMLKVKFYNAEKNLHNQFLCLDHQGYARQQAIKLLKSWAHNPEHINELHKEKMLNVASMLDLMSDCDIIDRYFRKVSSITLKPVPDTKYKELVKIEFS